MGISIPPNFQSEIRDLGPICFRCIALNLSIEEQGKELRINCTRCNRPYCDKCASKTDPQFCTECLTDFQVLITDETRNGIEHVRVIDPMGEKPDGIVAIPYKAKYRQIKLMGTDWLFYETAIAGMSDDQLSAALQWHKAAVSEIEIEVTERRIKKAHQQASQPFSKIVNIQKKQSDQAKLQAKALNLVQTFLKVHGAEALQKAMDLLAKQGQKV